MTHQTIINWRGKGLPESNDLRDCFKWYCDRKLGNPKDRLDESRTLLADMQRERLEREVRRLDRELVERSLVEMIWTRLVGAFRARILLIPSKLAGQLAGLTKPNVIRAKIEAEVHEALAELGDEGTLGEVFAVLPPDKGGGSANGAASAGRNGESVGGLETPTIA